MRRRTSRSSRRSDCLVAFESFRLAFQSSQSCQFLALSVGPRAAAGQYLFGDGLRPRVRPARGIAGLQTLSGPASEGAQNHGRRGARQSVTCCSGLAKSRRQVPRGTAGLFRDRPAASHGRPFARQTGPGPATEPPLARLCLGEGRSWQGLAKGRLALGKALPRGVPLPGHLPGETLRLEWPQPLCGRERRRRDARLQHASHAVVARARRLRARARARARADRPGNWARRRDAAAERTARALATSQGRTAYCRSGA